MRINNNLMAMNTHRQLGIASNNGAKSMEKLSSGLRINKAGDDAAGLAISEKMRGQIRGLNQASRNAQDGISLVQTAEGALQETQAILQRMRELSVQASSDTNVLADRSAIQDEVNELAEEIGRIASTTEFNSQNLLSGDFNGTFHIGANEGQNISLDINSMQSFDLGITGDITTRITGLTIAPTAGTDLVAEGADADGTYTAVDDGNGGFNLLDSSDKVVATSTDGLIFTGNSKGALGDDAFTLTGDAVANGGEIVISGGNITEYDSALTNTGLEAGTYSLSVADDTITDANGNVVATTTDDITYTLTSDSSLSFTFAAAITADTTVEVGGTDILSQGNADNAITTINDALTKVSDQRAKLGAVQNRLEHSIKNLDTSSENLQAAESRVRDVDMAKEMMNFTKNNILQQAAQAMLAQAQSSPQGVLQLLR